MLVELDMQQTLAQLHTLPAASPTIEWVDSGRLEPRYNYRGPPSHSPTHTTSHASHSTPSGPHLFTLGRKKRLGVGMTVPPLQTRFPSCTLTDIPDDAEPSLSPSHRHLPPIDRSSPELTNPHVSSPHISSPHRSSPHRSSPHRSSPHISSPRMSSLAGLFSPIVKHTLHHAPSISPEVKTVAMLVRPKPTRAPARGLGADSSSSSNPTSTVSPTVNPTVSSTVGPMMGLPGKTTWYSGNLTPVEPNPAFPSWHSDSCPFAVPGATGTDLRLQPWGKADEGASAGEAAFRNTRFHAFTDEI